MQSVAEQSVDENLRQAVVEAVVSEVCTLKLCGKFGHLFPSLSEMMRDQLFYLFALEVLKLLNEFLVLVPVSFFLFCLL